MMLDTTYTVVLQKRSNYPNFGVYIGKDIPSGFYIVTIEPNSPAADTNIQPGDRVLAINGQLVSLLTENPTDIILRISKQAQNLTLSLASSDILKFAGISPMNNNIGYTLQRNQVIDYDLENYLKSLLNSPLLSNESQYNSSTSTYALQSRRHHRRKRRALKTIETQTSFTNEQQENYQTSSPRRSIPSMGTPHVMLRSAQLTPKDNEINNISEVKSSPMITPVPPQLPSPRLIPEIGSTSSSSSPSPAPIRGDGLHDVHLYRVPNFTGYGFHLQYNRAYYMIHHIEPNSPAEHSGLRARDVVREINQHSTDGMPHKTFIEIISRSQQITFRVQPYDNFIRNHPEALRPSREITSNYNKKPDKTSQSHLSRALSKLKGR